MCRNVLIYFDEETKCEVLGNMHKLFNPQGYLFLGSTETVFGVTDKYKMLEEHRGLYQPIL